MTINIVRVHVFIRGRVQGVWYRGSMAQEAEQVGVAGWVKNLRDGRVEAVIEGRGEAVEHMVRWCGQGPPGARVEAVDVADEAVEGLVEFDIAY